MSGELRAGETIAGYRIEGVVARGGMGVVYRATQLELERIVALKVIADELGANTEFRERFRHEARLAARLEHTNVVPVYEAGEDHGRLYLAMRFIDGTDLRELVEREGRLAPQRALKLAAQIAAALDAAHAVGLIHRDVKPANVLVTGAGTANEHAYLTDFGIAKIGGVDLTRTGQWVGTPNYAAPEQFRGDGAVPQTDTYALAGVVYAMLTGHPPYMRDSDLALMYAHLSDPAPSIADIVPEVPAATDAVMARGLAKEPSDRPSSASQLVLDLADTLVMGDTAAAREAATKLASADPGATRKAPPPAPTPEAPPTPAPASPPAAPAARSAPPASRRGLLIGVGALVAAAVVAVLVLGGGGGEGEDGGETPGGSDGSPAVSAPTSAGDATVGEAIELGAEPSAVAASEGDGVWITTNAACLQHVDPESEEFGTCVTLEGSPVGVAIGEGKVWATIPDSERGPLVAAIDPASETVTDTFPVEGGASGVAVGGGYVWVANPGENSVTRMGLDGTDPKTINVEGPPVALVVAEDRVWVTLDPDGLVAIDAVSGEMIGRGGGIGDDPIGIATNGSSVYVTGAGGGGSLAEVEVLDDLPQAVDGPYFPLPAAPRALTVYAGSIWLANDDGTVTRVDPDKLEASERLEGFEVGPNALAGIAAAGEKLWVTDPTAGTLTPIKLSDVG